MTRFRQSDASHESKRFQGYPSTLRDLYGFLQFSRGAWYAFPELKLCRKGAIRFGPICAKGGLFDTPCPCLFSARIL